jgi:hypothetical protein
LPDDTRYTAQLDNFSVRASPTATSSKEAEQIQLGSQTLLRTLRTLEHSPIKALETWQAKASGVLCRAGLSGGRRRWRETYFLEK